jgi:arginyl-tRNA synthetase
MDMQLLKANIIDTINGITEEDKLQELKQYLDDLSELPYWAKDAAILNELKESDMAYEKGESATIDWAEAYKQLKEKNKH